MTRLAREPAADEPDRADLRSGWRYRAMVWTALAAALGYLAFATWSGWRNVATALVQVGLPGVGVALSLSLLNYGVRFLRWQAYLKAMGHRVSAWPSLKIYIGGFALTTTPGKAGEALRCVLLKPWGVPWPTTFACLLGERLSDMVAIVVLAMLGLMGFPKAQPLMAVGIVALLAGFAILSNRRLLERLRSRLGTTSRAAGVGRHVIEVLLQARQCFTPRLLAIATLASLVAWAAEGFAFHLVLARMGIDTPVTLAIAIYAVSLLAGAVSFMPGGLGSAEAVMAWFLLWQGASGAQAIAATVVIRLATLWFAVALGALLLVAADDARQPSRGRGDDFQRKA